MSDAVERRVGWIFAAACAVLIGWLLWRDLTAPLMWGREQVNIDFGLWGTRFLLAGLMATPLSQVLRNPALKRLRRPLGLGATLFAALHAVHYLAYAGIWPNHLQVLIRRKYLTIGVIALLLLIPLAATSFNGAVRWLGPRRWRWLHRLVYAAAALTVLHEVWGWGKLVGEVGAHVAALLVLLGWRLVVALIPILRGISPRPPYKVVAGGQ